jgi:hypothetical protein
MIGFELTTLVVIYTDSTGYYKSNYPGWLIEWLFVVLRRRKHHKP